MFPSSKDDGVAEHALKIGVSKNVFADMVTGKNDDASEAFFQATSGTTSECSGTIRQTQIAFVSKIWHTQKANTTNKAGKAGNTQCEQ